MVRVLGMEKLRMARAFALPSFVALKPSHASRPAPRRTKRGRRSAASDAILRAKGTAGRHPLILEAAQTMPNVWHLAPIPTSLLSPLFRKKVAYSLMTLILADPAESHDATRLRCFEQRHRFMKGITITHSTSAQGLRLLRQISVLHTV
jgi:hypothetical protein